MSAVTMKEQNEKSAVFTAAEVAERADVSVGTLHRWVKAGAIPQYDGVWTPGASAHARIVSQLRKSGESLEEIVLAAADGRLALGSVDELFLHETTHYNVDDVAKQLGLDKKLIEQIWVNMGFSVEGLDQMSEGDVEALKRIATVGAGICRRCRRRGTLGADVRPRAVAARWCQW